MLALLPILLLSSSDSLLVSPAWLDAHRKDPDLIVLHVSMERADYERGHVPGARWVDPHSLATMGAPGVELPPVQRIDSILGALGITDHSRIVFYGDTWMAPRVFLALDYVGLGDRTALLDGGLPAWRASGKALSTEAVTWKPSQLTLQARPEIVAQAAWLASQLNNPRLALIDGRSLGEYDGSDHSEHLPRSGHLPGAVNLPWEKTFTDPARALDGVPSPLVRPEVLRKLFADAGVTSEKDLVTYCTVGLRASHLYFVARYLGWHPRIYDGSASEWSRKPELPMVSGSKP